MNEIMPLIYRRFTEKSAEEWRQIYKSLQLLEFLIKNGSERVIDDARGHITLLKMLRQFHYIDQNGKDQGINVRNRAKELTELLGDVERIRSERKKARATKNKYTGVEGGTSFGGGFSSGSGGRYGGFGSESAGYGGGDANFGGFSGGVYGDGGGFGGSEYQENASRSDRFEEYDEFDEGERPSASRTSKRPERAVAKKTTAEAPKKKEPEVDLFSFDEPEQSSSAAAAPSNGSGLADLAGPSSSAAAAADDDDDFDDFQSAPTTSSQPVAATVTATSNTAQIAAPKPLAGPQQAAGINQMVNMVSPGSSTSATPGANYSAFSAPQQQNQPPKPTGYQPSGPNYFGNVQAGQGSTTVTSPTTTTPSASTGPTTMANMRPVASNAAKPAPAAAGGDAFGALWGKASSGIKKTNTNAAGPAMGQLAKEKSSAGIWGANASNTQPPAGGSGSASGDLLF